jgi:hypothetical protein
MIENLIIFRLPKDISQLELPTETKANRLFDIAFMKKVYILIIVVFFSYYY